MRSMGWRYGKIDFVLSIIAGILHLGQVKFVGAVDGSGLEIAMITDMRTVEDCVNFMNVQQVHVQTWLPGSCSGKSFVTGIMQEQSYHVSDFHRFIFSVIPFLGGGDSEMQLVLHEHLPHADQSTQVQPFLSWRRTPTGPILLTFQSSSPVLLMLVFVVIFFLGIGL